MVLAPFMDFFPPLFILSVSIFIHFLNVGGGGKNGIEANKPEGIMWLLLPGRP